MSVRPPNILWIVTTQWRAQACGYAGDPNARTPHLDALARRAIDFTQAVTPHPFGPFARAALLTGVASPENGVRDYFDPLPVESATIAQALRARGYVTGFFGKWHLGRRDPHAPLVGEAHARTRVPPEGRGGFEVWDGFESGFQLNDPWLHGWTSEEPEQQHGYQSDVVCGRAVEFISQQRAEMRPWFVVVSLESPHPPYAAPAGGVPSRDPREIVLAANVPRGGDAEARARRELAGYYAHIEATDRAIGATLLANPALADAAVVFTSVHGDMHGAHGLFRKGWPHEESVRVPLLVRPPHGLVVGGVPSTREKVRLAAQRRGVGAPRLQAGQREDLEFGVRSLELVSLLDVPRWAIAWADGRQLQTPNSKLETEMQRISMPSVVRLPDQCDRMWRAARTAQRKLVLGADGAPWLFFDLERDPEERTNLVGDSARRAEIEALTRLLKPARSPETAR